MDPTTTAHPDGGPLGSIAAIHPDTLTTSTIDGTPALTVKSPTTTSSQAKSTSAQPTVTGLRQRVNALGTQLDQATEHPAVKDAKGAALRQVDQFREFLGRSPAIVRAEKQTGVDRVALVAGGAFAYLLLVPLNLFHLAFFTTTLLTFVPPLLLALRVLDQPNEQRTKLLLSYFTVFGFVQFAESLAGGFLAKRIPQYFTVKLLFLAYLIHPKTKGAFKIYEAVLKPLLAPRLAARTPTTTPPSSRPFGAGSSPTQPPAATGIGNQIVGGGTVHLPSGGGTGVGLDAPKEPLI